MGSIADNIGHLVGSLTGDDQADAAHDAARAQEEYIRQAIAEYQKTYGDQQNLLSGQQGIGNAALNQYAGLFGIGAGGQQGGAPDYSQFFKSPGYQFQLQQGNKAIGQLQASRGNLFSGGAGQDYARFNQGLAGQAFDTYANRLGAFANLGPQTNQLLAGYRGQQGQQTGQALTGIGDARAGGSIGAANAYGNAAGNLLQFASNFYGGGMGGSGGYAQAAGGGSMMPSEQHYQGTFGSY